jgi:hypothetical protein
MPDRECEWVFNTVSYANKVAVNQLHRQKNNHLTQRPVHVTLTSMQKFRNPIKLFYVRI